MNKGTGATATPGIAYRHDTGRVISEEKLTVAEDLRRISGPEPDQKQNAATDHFLDELELTLEIYTDWIPPEPLRFLTSSAKSVTDRPAALIAAKPANSRQRESGSLNDPDGFRTPIKEYALPGTAKVPMTIDRIFTQSATAHPHPPLPPAEPGFRRVDGKQKPGALNQALAPVFAGISPGDVVNIDRHVRYAGQHWNAPNFLWRRLAPRQQTSHVPTKEGSYSRSGNKGRQAASALSPGVLRSNLARVLNHDYPVITRGESSGISYGMELTGIGRPLPRETPQNANPRTGLTVQAHETEEHHSYARDTANQAWINPLFDGGRAEGQPAIPHVNNLRTIEPVAGVTKHHEANYRTEDTFVGYQFTGQDILHSRGVSFILDTPGSATGLLRHVDAVKLAERFPKQVVHPDAVTFADKQGIAALRARLNGARPPGQPRSPRPSTFWWRTARSARPGSSPRRWPPSATPWTWPRFVAAGLRGRPASSTARSRLPT